MINDAIAINALWADFNGWRTPQLNVKEGNSIHGVTNNQFVTRGCHNCSFTMLPNPVFSGNGNYSY